MNVDALGFWFLKNEVHQRFVSRFGAGTLRHRYLDAEKLTGDHVDADADVKIFSHTPTPPLVFANERSSRLEHKPSESSVTFRLRNARLNTASGYVFDSEGALMADFASWPASSLRIDRLATPGRARRRFIGEDYLFLGTQGFYHWLIEDLPAYQLARAETPEAITLIRPRSPRYVTDALELLGTRFIVAPVSARVESLVLASKGVALVPNRMAVQSLREFQDELSPSPASGPARRIYISRRDSSRFPDNEVEVEECVRGLGLEIVNLAAMNFAEQISLFAGARIVAGTHGAGLANIVWCAPQTTAVVEILRDNNPRCFEELAAAADLHYSAIVAPSEGPWRVDIPALTRQLEAAILASDA